MRPELIVILQPGEAVIPTDWPIRRRSASERRAYLDGLRAGGMGALEVVESHGAPNRAIVAAAVDWQVTLDLVAATLCPDGT